MTKESAKSKVEKIKRDSRGLRGTIAEELGQAAEKFSKDNSQILKFHGIYQQENRDLRKERREAGEGKAYQFMVRIKNPGGGRLTAQQWVALDRVADQFGDGTLRITSRQGIQFHGVGKDNLRNLIRNLNRQVISTFGACGDGNRNTMACPVSGLRGRTEFDGRFWAAAIGDRLSFHTSAYVEIWLDGEKVVEQTDEPLYQETYLPRKFKIAVSDPEDNCVDLLTNDVGILPRLKDARLEGFHVFVGGGLGSTHGKKETFPRLADPLTFVSPERLLDVVEAILKTQRDLGNRQDRRQARLKYLVERLGTEGFRKEVERRLKASLPPSQDFALKPVDHHFGWHRQGDEGMNYLGLFVENGRIGDFPNLKLKSGLRTIIERFEPSVFLTPNQDLILADIPESRRSEIQMVIGEFGLGADGRSTLRRNSMACPALPTCGLAITEAERRLPDVMTQLEEAGLGGEAVNVRMSGCPNSCSRPPTAEIGLVGKSLRTYSLYVGGNRAGTRLAELLAEDVDSEALADQLGKLLRLFRRGRAPGEDFGDFCHRVGVEGLRSQLPLEETPA